MEKIRISKYFTDCGVMSRRAAEDEISKGKVKVNGIVAELGQKIDPECDQVEYKGRIIKARFEEKICIALNKPRGIVTTAQDEKGRANVTDLVKIKDAYGKMVRLYPIGRLDMDSDGLLLMTNDGELANKLTHPKHTIPKLYHVTLPYLFTDEDIRALGQPIVIDGRKTAPVKIRKVRENSQGYNSYTVLEFELYEGRNRQIRKMCEQAGLTVRRLNRVAIGKLKLGGLPVGKWRYLEPQEIEYLRRSTAGGNRR